MNFPLQDEFLTKARSLYEQQVDRISPYLGISGHERVRLKEQVRIITFSKMVTEWNNKLKGELGLLSLQRSDCVKRLKHVGSHRQGTEPDPMEKTYANHIRTLDDTISVLEGQLDEWSNMLPTSMISYCPGDNLTNLVVEDGVSEEAISHIVGNEFGHLIWSVLAPERKVNISVNECFEVLVHFVHSFFAEADEEINLIYECAKNYWDKAVSQDIRDVQIRDDEVLFRSAYSMLGEGKSKDDILDELYRELYENRGKDVIGKYEYLATHGETWLNMKERDDAAVERFLDAAYPTTEFTARQGEEMYIKKHGEPGHLIGCYLALTILAPPANWRIRKRDYHCAVLETISEAIRSDMIDISEPMEFLKVFKARVSEKSREPL